MTFFIRYFYPMAILRPASAMAPPTGIVYQYNHRSEFSNCKVKP